MIQNDSEKFLTEYWSIIHAYIDKGPQYWNEHPEEGREIMNKLVNLENLWEVEKILDGKVY